MGLLRQALLARKGKAAHDWRKGGLVGRAFREGQVPIRVGRLYSPGGTSPRRTKTSPTTTPGAF
jgi:hypothetical protein